MSAVVEAVAAVDSNVSLEQAVEARISGVAHCGACGRASRGEVLWRFGGVCRRCHFRRSYPQLGVGNGEVK